MKQKPLQRYHLLAAYNMQLIGQSTRGDLAFFCFSFGWQETSQDVLSAL
jgi:hypothetical protein